MRTIAKIVGFVEGFIFALVAFMATVGGLSVAFNVNWKAVNESTKDNVEL